MMRTAKTMSCFRLCPEAMICLDRLEEAPLAYRSRTDIVEQAIIELYDRKIGHSVSDMDIIDFECLAKLEG